jgi:hypothetical protein
MMLRDTSADALKIGAAPVDRVTNHVRLLDDAFHGYALPLLGPDPFSPYGRL